MAEEKKKYNWANWNIKEQPKIELEDIPEEPKKERTAAEREKEIGELRYNIMSNVTNELENNNYHATKEVFNKGIVKSNIKVYGRFRSFLMDNKKRIAVFTLAMLFFGLSIGLLFTKGTSLEMPTQLLVFLTTGSAIIGFALLFYVVEG